MDVQTGLWRFFPWYVAAAMTAVVVVNSGMVFTALRTFPGAAGGDGFALSNHYEKVLDSVRREASLGWQARADIDAAGRPLVTMIDHSGGPLTGAGIAATARRPLGDEHATAIQFREIAPGRYVGDLVLEQKGQWELLLNAAAGGHEFSATLRIVVR